MGLTYDDAKRTLDKHGQAHVLQFWNELSAAQRGALLEQVEQLDFASLDRMRGLLKTGSAANTPDAIRPAPVEVLDAAARLQARKRGEQAIRQGQVGVILVAGGQGSRLGFEGPKGAFPIGPITGATLFEIHCRKILALERAHATTIPLYIMTSDSNDADTRAFFARHACFGLAPERVKFFVQGMWPALGEDGRMILDRPDHLFMSPDGHGGTVTALLASGMLEDMERRGVDMLFYFQVDNPLVEVADPVFLGFHAEREADISIKVCAKRDPEEKLGVVVERQGRRAIVEYSELTPEQMHAIGPDGRLQFSHGSVAIHIFGFSFLKQQANAELPLHLAHKKVPSCGPDGVVVSPDHPNAYKFEKFIFDVIPNTDRAFVMEFDRAEEFSPVKNSKGEDSPATCQRDLTMKYVRRLEAAGVMVPRAAGGEPRFKVEIDPAFASNAEELRARLAPKLPIAGDLLLA